MCHRRHKTILGRHPIILCKSHPSLGILVFGFMMYSDCRLKFAFSNRRWPLIYGFWFYDIFTVYKLQIELSFQISPKKDILIGVFGIEFWRWEMPFSCFHVTVVSNHGQVEYNDDLLSYKKNTCPLLTSAFSCDERVGLLLSEEDAVNSCLDDLPTGCLFLTRTP